MAMKTLDEFNKERESVYELIRRSREPHPNGIECPRCFKELWDSSPEMTLTSNPPKKNVHCQECGYRGYRLA